ncbi:hypothetical protein ABBQ32_000514 [Trebouxia sp. C0010 RCD-2024]
MGILGFNLNFYDQLSFYGAYHHNKWNQLVHFVFVPAIFWSASVWLSYTGQLIPYDPARALHSLPTSLAECAVLNGAFLGTLVYSLFYIGLEPFAGATWALSTGIPCWLTATAFMQHVPNAWAYAVALHALSWYVQIHVGHVMLEHRKPALLDSFFQSLALANLFVWLEFLFFCGYRKDLQAKLAARIQAERAKMLADDVQTARLLVEQSK